VVSFVQVEVLWVGEMETRSFFFLLIFKKIVLRLFLLAK